MAACQKSPPHHDSRRPLLPLPPRAPHDHDVRILLLLHHALHRRTRRAHTPIILNTRPAPKNLTQPTQSTMTPTRLTAAAQTKQRTRRGVALEAQAAGAGVATQAAAVVDGGAELCLALFLGVLGFRVPRGVVVVG